MDSIEKKDRYAKWKELIAEQEKSGLSQTEFCKQHNLVASKFGYYRGVIKLQERVGANSELFSPIHVKKSELNHLSEIKITLPNGFQCALPCAMDTTQIKKLMETLLSC